MARPQTMARLRLSTGAVCVAQLSARAGYPDRESKAKALPPPGWLRRERERAVVGSFALPAAYLAPRLRERHHRAVCLRGRALPGGSALGGLLRLGHGAPPEREIH